ncbi:MAG: PilZ domain-containing protein [Candidatus Omnitrophica bacterium]|nr:PilZ domain-containing protein [Candidatus Omnitrophota bacterium]
MQNKRKTLRHDCLVPVDSGAQGPFGASKTVDFSKGGLGFVSNHRVALNKEIAIQLDLSQEGDPTLVMGKVKWVSRVADSEHFRIGVAFEHVPKDAKADLADYFQDREGSGAKASA